MSIDGLCSMYEYVKCMGGVQYFKAEWLAYIHRSFFQIDENRSGRKTNLSSSPSWAVS